MLNRREFGKRLLTGASALAVSIRAWSVASAVQAKQSSDESCDLLIKGGTVVDPGQRLHARMDVAVKSGKILAISRDFPEARALQVVNARDKIVTPGLIDIHVHCYDGVADCISADHYCLTKGVTTVVDGGSAGYPAIANFHHYVINPSVTRVKASVNISPLGAVGPGGTVDAIKLLDAGLTAKAVLDNMPAAVGIKARLQESLQGANDVEYLKKAVQAAEAARVPVMAHIDGPHSPLSVLLPMLRKGDVFTHFLNAHQNGVLDANGKILSVVREARQRGVILDVAQGRSHLSFDVARKCLDQDFLPDTLSTDLTRISASDRVYDLPTIVSKFIALGVDLDKAIQMVTANPARVFDYGAPLGTLQPGSEADIAIFELRDGNFEFDDSDGKKLPGRQKLFNKAVVRHGHYFVNES